MPDSGTQSIVTLRRKIANHKNRTLYALKHIKKRTINQNK